MVFAAKLDMPAKAITIVVLTLVMATVFFLTDRFFNYQDQIDFIQIALLSLLLPFIYSFMPQSYSLCADGLSINRPFGKKRIIPAAEIKNMIPFHRAPGFSMRMLGSGGLFGYLGIFYYSNTGLVHMYCTDHSRMILVTAVKRKYIISPDDRDAFMAEWQRLSK
ncbi:PH domain-containing protein [Chitinophagaceae bacterium MMS25-I14]